MALSSLAAPSSTQWWPLSVRAFRCWLTVYRRIWRSSIWSSVLGPVCYLGALGFGLGALVDKHSLASLGGVSYLAFVAPAILASGAMNSAMSEASYPVFGSLKWSRIYIGAQASPLRPADIFRGHLMFNVFFRLKYAKLYDAVLATPMRPAQVALGEIGWALLRGTIYAAAFMLVMLALDLVHSPWAVLDVPVAVLIGFAFSAIGMFGTTYMKSWQDFDYVILVSMPLFLFSATFYPLSVYPRAAQVVIECTPLYQGVVLLRALTVGLVGPGLLWRVAYLAALGVAGLYASGRRIGKLLLV